MLMSDVHREDGFGRFQIISCLSQKWIRPGAQIQALLPWRGQVTGGRSTLAAPEPQVRWPAATPSAWYAGGTPRACRLRAGGCVVSVPIGLSPRAAVLPP